MAAAVGALIGPLSAWFLAVDRTVAELYLDEVFHARQAQQYCAGNFHVWDPKITTPPALYWLSYAFAKIIGCDPFALRALNAVALAALVVLVQATYRYRSPQHYTGSNGRLLIQHSALNIALFPPLFFFSALYYTDVPSTLFVIVFFMAFVSSHNAQETVWYRTVKLVPLGIVSLMFRQTNIFWVAIFPAGMVLVQELDRGHEAVKHSMKRGVEGFGDSLLSIAKTSWKMEVIYDPSLRDAWFEDHMKTVVSVVACLLKVATQPKRLIHLVTALLPYLALLTLFTIFVVWNGGVVLGDKSNHVATLHLPQMLYIWPYLTFFSWPLIYHFLMLLPISLLARITQYSHLETFLVFKRRRFLPRFWLALLFVLTACLVVKFNTIVHPFTLADNRHYTFYVFRILLKRRWTRYAAAPVYVLCGWACIQALGAGPDMLRRNITSRQDETPDSARDRPAEQNSHQAPSSPRSLPDGVHAATTSFVLIWLATSALQLITAPLVEPRYFILPWIFWRLHLPLRQAERPSPGGQKSTESSSWWQLLWERHDHRLWLETLWMLAVNAITGYIFLNWGFTWPQEPGKVQRFMW